MTDRIPITEDIRNHLIAERQRTGFAQWALLKFANCVPEGLSASIIGYWMRGEIKTATPEHLDFVLEQWGKLPDRSQKTSRKSTRLKRRALTPADINALLMEKERTGKGPSALLGGASDKPQGLSSSGTIYNWLSARVQYVREDHYSYVLARWRALPDKIDYESERQEKRRARQTNRVARPPIPKDILKQLHAERIRTRKTTALFNGRSDMPNGFAQAMLSAWLSGSTNVAHPEHLSYVLECYAKAETMVAISNDLIELLLGAKMKAKGWKPLLPMLRTPPAMLTAAKLSRMVNGYEAAIPETLSVYLSKECQRILSAKPD